jgi:hypothetical protein
MFAAERLNKVMAVPGSPPSKILNKVMAVPGSPPSKIVIFYIFIQKATSVQAK